MTWDFDSPVEAYAPPTPAPRAARRRVYGRVYETFCDDTPPGAHAYVGLVRAPRTMLERHNEKMGEPEAWKRHIIPGSRGYRQLEVVYCTDDPADDEARLRRAEADWIDRYATLHNGVRPVRPPGPRVVKSRPATTPPRHTARETAQRRRVRNRSVVLAVLFGLYVPLLFSMISYVTRFMPWPWLPWVLAPVLGFVLTYRTFVSGRRLLGIR